MKGEVWDAATGDLLFELVGHTGEINDVEFSPDGKLLATAGEDGTARSGTLQRENNSGAWLDTKASVSKVAFSPDGKSLATGGIDGTIKFWDWAQ